MSKILLVVFATAILNNLILYFWKPWLIAYGAGNAKNLAWKEELDKIFAEMRAVTAIQKQIEAQLSGTEWNRQILWNKRAELWNKRAELYSSVMSVFCELEDSMIQLKSLSREPLRDPKEFQLAVDRRSALELNLRKLGGPMILFGTDAASKAISNYFSKSIKAITPEEQLEALVDAQSAVCEEARAHLHLKESMPSRSE